MSTNTDITLAERFLTNQRLTTLVFHLLAGLMLACLTVTVIQVAEYLFPQWNGDYLVTLSFLVALEAMYARRAIQRYDMFSRERLLYRVTEWVVLLLLIKLVIYQVNGFNQLWSDLFLWRQNFALYFFTDEYLLAFSLIFVVWALAGMFGEDLQKLEGDERILRMERESGISEQRPAVRRSLANLIFSLGAAMIFPVALLRLDWEALIGNRAPLQAPMINIVVYFVLALILLSLTQFSILRVHWSLERIPIGRNMASRWVISSGLFLLALGVVALLLPTDYSLGLLDVLGYLVSLIMGLVGILVFLLSLPLILLLSLLGRLFGREYDIEPPELEMPQALPPAAAGSVPWFELLKSILFWVVFLAIIGYSLYFYIRQNSELLDRLRRIPLLGRLLAWLQRTFGWLRVVNNNLRQAAARQMRRIFARDRSPAGEGGWSFISLRRLSPRQKVLFYYLAMVRRGGDRGLPRDTSQTPYEYAERIGQALPELRPDVGRMTEEFLEARYSRHEITAGRAGLVQTYWQRIRKALQRRS